ncbi:MAG: hypothetical protein K0S74_846 [Chlamydiales bacterium]|jgi:hypothetical protein|nr:hypothetical protein [Chlamydiales bacterium]
MNAIKDGFYGMISEFKEIYKHSTNIDNIQSNSKKNGYLGFDPAQKVLARIGCAVKAFKNIIKSVGSENEQNLDLANKRFKKAKGYLAIALSSDQGSRNEAVKFIKQNKAIRAEKIARDVKKGLKNTMNKVVGSGLNFIDGVQRGVNSQVSNLANRLRKYSIF